MIISIPEVRKIPLPCAVFDKDGSIVSSSPEWKGAVPGSASYPFSQNRLVINPAIVEPECELILEKLLNELEQTAQHLDSQHARRVEMLATSLRIVAGRNPGPIGTTEDLLEYVQAGISARTSLQVTITRDVSMEIKAPAVAALILVQFAANAEKHEQVTHLEIRQQKKIFNLIWQGGASLERHINSARLQSERERWGLGFARIAADTIGGAIYPPQEKPDGSVVATLELGLNRLTLPMAVVKNNRIFKSTRTWDDETNTFAGAEINRIPKLAALIAKSFQSRGQIIDERGWFLRAINDEVWVAIPPDDILNRAKDVLQGISHEKALWEDVPEPWQTRVFVLASLLRVMLGGTSWIRVPGTVWNKMYDKAAEDLEVGIDAPPFEGVSALDPRIAAYFAKEFGTRFETDGDELLLVVKDEMRDDPFMNIFLRPGSNALKLSM